MSNPIPPEIITAVLKTQGECGQLGKDDFNKHAGYNFVSIDSYYEKVARLATANGLTWVARCVETVQFSEKAVLFTYEYDVVHASGAVAQSYMTHPILHAVQGAQTAGSALSYADKLFMRSAFKVVTGEQDADTTDPKAFDMDPPKRALVSSANDNALDFDLPATAPKPADPELGEANTDESLVDLVKQIASGVDEGKPVLRAASKKGDLALIEEVFVKFVDLCETGTELKRFWNQNAAALDSVAKHDPERHGRIKAAFIKRRDSLEKK